PVSVVDPDSRHRPRHRPSLGNGTIPLHRPSASRRRRHRRGLPRGRQLRPLARRRRCHDRQRSLPGDVVTDRVDHGPEFDAFLSEHRSRVYGVALRVVSDPELADDVVQETFLRAWRGLARFRGESSLSTWLHRITINTALTARRRDARHHGKSLDSVDEVVAEATPYVDPERGGEVLDLRQELQVALDKLPAGQ